jgi:hypothetical protein
VRVAFFVLLLANLIYLAWAVLVDAPVPAPATRVDSRVPRLVLASEVNAQASQPENPGAPAIARNTAAADSSPSHPKGAARCVSVGPFNDLARTARAAALLRERGFEPQQRAEEGEMWEGFWVFVDGLKTAAEESRVLKDLERAGIDDAHAMPESEAGRRVSVGLFSERDRAERRARALKRLGFTPQITEKRQAGTVYWVDLDLGVNDRTVPTEGLLSLEESGARLEIRVCPGSQPTPASPAAPVPPREARPATTTADARASRPG